MAARASAVRPRRIPIGSMSVRRRRPRLSRAASRGAVAGRTARARRGRSRTIASVGLDRDRRCGRCGSSKGSPTGQVAYVTKVHHSLADGMSSARLLAESCTERPDAHADAGIGGRSTAEPMPGWWRTARGAASPTCCAMARRPSGAARSHRGATPARCTRARRAGEPRAAEAVRRPAHALRRAPHPASLVRVRDVRRSTTSSRSSHAFDARVNDVVRRDGVRRTRAGTSTRHGELPDAPLTAAVPVSVRKPEEERVWGNRVASWYVSLATDVQRSGRSGCRPIVRSDARRACGARSDRSRAAARDGPSIGGCSGCRRSAFPKMARPFVGRPSYNVIVSTVPGPPGPLYRHGARLVHMISMGPLVEGIGYQLHRLELRGRDDDRGHGVPRARARPLGPDRRSAREPRGADGRRRYGTSASTEAPNGSRRPASDGRAPAHSMSSASASGMPALTCPRVGHEVRVDVQTEVDAVLECEQRDVQAHPSRITLVGKMPHRRRAGHVERDRAGRARSRRACSSSPANTTGRATRTRRAASPPMRNGGAASPNEPTGCARRTSCTSFAATCCARSCADALGRIRDVGRQRDDDERQLVVERGVAFGAHRHRHARGERMLRQLVAIEQVRAQRARAQGEHDVVDLHVEVLRGAPSRRRAPRSRTPSCARGPIVPLNDVRGVWRIAPRSGFGATRHRVPAEVDPAPGQPRACSRQRATASSPRAGMP